MSDKLDSSPRREHGVYGALALVLAACGGAPFEIGRADAGPHDVAARDGATVIDAAGAGDGTSTGDDGAVDLDGAAGDGGLDVGSADGGGDGPTIGNGDGGARDGTTGGPYTIGGSASGLRYGDVLELQDNGADTLTITSNGTFTFAHPLAQGAAYGVTVLLAPTGRTCTLTNASGTVGFANVTNVQVACP